MAPLPDEVGHPEQHGVRTGDPWPRGARARAASCRSSASATRMPSSRNATACLLLRPIPATTPATSHSLGRSSTSAWVTRTRTAVQASVSNVAVDSRWPTVMTTALAATVTAVSTWADRAPPSSRANCTASSTSAGDGHDAPEAEHDEVVLRQLGGQPRQQRRERRLVRVAPRQPLPGRDEVELVAVRPVVRRHGEQQRRLDRDDQGDRPPGVRRSLGGHARIFSRSRATVSSARPRPSRR